MTVEIIKHFVNNGVEYGYYLVDGTLVVQNGDEYKAIPHFFNKPISDCLLRITDGAIAEIKNMVAGDTND